MDEGIDGGFKKPQRIRLRRVFQSPSQPASLQVANKTPTTNMNTRRFPRFGSVSSIPTILEEDEEEVEVVKNKAKCIAQDIYYRKKSGQSPMTRALFNNEVGKKKAPVHTRLGECTARYFSSHFGSVLPPKSRRMQLMHKNQLKSPGTRPFQLFTRGHNFAQTRLRRIRMQQNMEAINNMQGPKNKRIKLRRFGAMPVQCNLQPTNYSVQVTNNRAVAAQGGPSGKHVIELNQKMQMEINILQSHVMHHEEIPPLPIHPQGFGKTQTPMHERFSLFVA